MPLYWEVLVLFSTIIIVVMIQFSSVRSLSRVQLFATPWIAVCQASLYHELPDLTQTEVYRVGDGIQPSHPVSSPSPPAFNLLFLSCFQSFIMTQLSESLFISIN